MPDIFDQVSQSSSGVNNGGDIFDKVSSTETLPGNDIFDQVSAPASSKISDTFSVALQPLKSVASSLQSPATKIEQNIPQTVQPKLKTVPQPEFRAPNPVEARQIGNPSSLPESPTVSDYAGAIPVVGNTIQKAINYVKSGGKVGADDLIMDLISYPVAGRALGPVTEAAGLLVRNIGTKIARYINSEGLANAVGSTLETGLAPVDLENAVKKGYLTNKEAEFYHTQSVDFRNLLRKQNAEAGAGVSAVANPKGVKTPNPVPPEPPASLLTASPVDNSPISEPVIPQKPILGKYDPQNPKSLTEQAIDYGNTLKGNKDALDAIDLEHKRVVGVVNDPKSSDTEMADAASQSQFLSEAKYAAQGRMIAKNNNILPESQSYDESGKVSEKSPQSNSLLDTVSNEHGGVNVGAIKDFINESNKQLQYSGDISDDYYKLQGQDESDRVKIRQILEKTNISAKDQEAIYHWIENPKEPITPEQKQIYDTSIAPIRDERNKLFAKLRNEGIPVNDEGYTPRKISNKGGVIDRLEQGYKGAMRGGTLRQTTGELKNRVMKAIEDGQGNRRVVSIKGGEVTEWNDGQSSSLGKLKSDQPRLTEYHDKEAIEALNKTIKNLDIKHARLPQGKNLSGRLGVSFTGQNRIQTRTATPMSVLIHEIGHQIDGRFGLQSQFVNNPSTKIELRKLADLRKQEGASDWHNKTYIRKGSEKMATMFEAYLNVPEQFKKVAPTTYKKFIEFLKSKDELKPIADFKPSLHYSSITTGGNTPGVFVDSNGKKWNIKDATTKEIESNTNLKYHKTLLLNELDAWHNLKRTDRAIEYLENLKTDPEFSRVAIKIGTQNIPNDYKTTILPQLRGYAFPTHIAETFDTLFKNASTGLLSPDSLYSIVNRVLRNSIFFNPLIHVPNIVNHAAVNRGLSSWFIPTRYIDLVKTSRKAIEATLTMNDDYIKALEEGAPLLYSKTVNKDLYDIMLEKMGKELEQSPELTTKIGKALGYANPINLVKAIYDFSGKATWAVNDIATLQSIYEEMGHGENFEEAMKDTGKHIPNYRIPPRVLGGRTISKLMSSDSGVTMFGAYHYGALKSYGEMFKTLIGDPSVKEKAKALDRLAMLAMITYFGYNALDKIAKKMTGNKNAGFRRAGASTFPYKTAQFAQGKIDFSDYIQSVLTPSIGLQAGVETLTGRDWRTGKKMPMKEMAIRSVAPLGQGERILSGQITPKNFGLSLVGISSPKSTIGNTPAEIAINRAYYDSLPQNERTPAAMEKAQLKSNLRAEKEQNNSDFQKHLDAAFNKGKISVKEYEDFAVPDKETQIQKRFHILDNNKQGEIILKSNKNEFDDLYPIYITKYVDTYLNKSDDEQKDMDAVYNKINALEKERIAKSKEPVKKTKLDELLEKIGLEKK